MADTEGKERSEEMSEKVPQNSIIEYIIYLMLKKAEWKKEH